MNTEITYFFKHPHNNTLTNERAVEIVLGLRYIDFTKGDLVEIGAVTSYYANSNHEIVDPMDKMATNRTSAENYDYRDKNILSISTIEHIGLGDWIPKRNKSLAFKVLDKIYKDSKSCFITWPIGYNLGLDKMVKENLSKFNYFFYVKRGRWQKKPKQSPQWELISDEKGFDFDYDSPFEKTANSIIFITKGI